jgi:PASTA domain
VGRNWKKLSLTSAVAALAALVLALPASASITTTNITTPGGHFVYQMYNDAASSNTFAIAGTTDSDATAADKVDVVCYYGGGYPPRYYTVATNVPLASNGTFSLPTASLGAVSDSECQLRAVRAGTAAFDNKAAFKGPVLLTSENDPFNTFGGPNDGKLRGFYNYAQQPQAANDFEDLTDGGLWDSYLFSKSYGVDTTVFYANAYLWRGNNAGVSNTRSEVQIDGKDAYGPGSASSLIYRSGACPPTCDGSQDNAGFPSFSYSFVQNHSSGDSVIHETDSFASCTGNPAYPPTHATCPSFTSTGVKDDRTIVQNQSGHVVLITDNYSSTDGHQHSIDLLYENDQYLNRSKPADTGYVIPGQSGYAVRHLGDTLTVPDRPDTVYVKNVAVADGDPYTGQGAITYSVAPSQIKFICPPTYSDTCFTMHYSATVPATGSLTYKFGYSTDYTTAEVQSEAVGIQHSYTPCVVPKLKGKKLRAAKALLANAYCGVGKIKKARSKKIKKGRVISSRPGAGVTKPYGFPVNLKVSRGKKK